MADQHIDLTRIEQPYRFLDLEVREALTAHHERGLETQWLNPIGEWHTKPAGHVLYQGITYRAAPKRITKPILDWSQVDDKWIAFAIDESGAMGLFSARPKLGADIWVPLGCEYVRVDGVLKVHRGTCDWRNSLVLRPEKAL